MRFVSPKEAHVLVEAENVVEVWDTRTLGEWKLSHIAGAKSMPHSEVVVNVKGCKCFTPITLPKGTPILVYGNNETASVLERSGFTQIYVLKGGLEAWRRAGLPYVISDVRSWRDIHD